MDIKLFKRLIKQAVKEALQEELKDILVEAVKAPRVPIGVSGYGVPTPITETVIHKTPVNMPKPNTREMYASLLNGMMENRNGNISLNSSDALNFGASQEYRPPVTANTSAEGSALPVGEVSLDQIMGIMTKK